MRDSSEDGVGMSSTQFARLRCLLAVMNLIPNEMQQRSLKRTDMLRHPANSSSELEGKNSSLCHFRDETLSL